MSNNPLSHSCCALCASKLPPSIRARLTSERLLHAVHSSPRLLLMTSQSRQKTAFQRGRTPASRWFLVPANIYTNHVAEMWAAILNKNTASYPMCKLSKPSAMWLADCCSSAETIGRRKQEVLD